MGDDAGAAVDEGAQQLEELVRERDVDGLARTLAGTQAYVIAEELARLAPEDRALPFRLLSKTRAMRVFELLDPPIQEELLDALRGDRRARDVLEEMDPDDRARLLDEMPAAVAKRLLAGLSPDERSATAQLLGYPEDSAGRLMSPEVLHLEAPDTVARALERVRATGAQAETVYTLPVTDEERRLVGVTSLRDLVLARPEQRIADLMDTRVISVGADADRERAARVIQEADLLALPVTDREGRLLGVITVDDAMEVLEEEQSEDVALGAAASPLDRPYLASSVLRIVRTRLPWLAMLIIPATLTAVVLAGFEVTLEEVTKLAWFIPLLIGTGGNAGAQAATTIVRAMAVDQVRFSDFLRVVLRELETGAVLGVGLALIGFVPAAVFAGWDIALVLCLSVVAIVTWATVTAAGLPIIAKRVGLDPAVVSTPLMSTFVDATGLVIYFTIATIVLEV
jgi:magnesium transporter